MSNKYGNIIIIHVRLRVWPRKHHVPVAKRAYRFLLAVLKMPPLTGNEQP